MTQETQTTKVEFLYLGFASGTVGPTELIEKGLVTQEGIHELGSRIKNGEYTTYADPSALPEHCVDPRDDEDGPVTGVKAAGGFMTPFMGDALTNRAYNPNGEKAPGYLANFLNKLKERGLRLGGHLRYKNDPPCGAIHKAHNKEEDEPSIMRFMAKEATSIFGVIRGLGKEVEPSLEASIPAQADDLVQTDFFTTGEELANTAKDTLGEDSFDKLPGQQHSVMVAIMTEPGAILDMERIKNDFPGYRIFELAAWAVRNGAEETSLTPDEAHQKEVAALAYNIATAAVIVGKDMPILVN